MNLDAKKPDFDAVVAHFREEIAGLRSNRATPALVENIYVEAYGAQQPILSLASISVPDPRTLVIDPWDKSILKDIEKAIQVSGKGINPTNEGDIVRITISPMSEETRREIVKNLGALLEKSKASVRTVREGIRKEVLDLFGDKQMSEDDKFFHLKKLDEMTEKTQAVLTEIATNKEKEIMTV